MPRYKLTIAYDGTDFCGWQKQEPYVDSHTPPKLARRLAAGERTPRASDTQPDPAAHAAHNAHDAMIFEDLGLREGETRPRIALRTVQAVVERAIREIVREPVSLQGSSRTDAGVHAWGQVAAFSCSPRDEELTPAPDACVTPRGAGGWPLARGVDRLLRAINSRLPDDVMVRSIEPVAHGFDPTNDASSKAYSYTLHTGETRPLRDRRFVHHVREHLDVDAMRQAARHLVGEHDFVSFAALHHGRLTTVRTIFSCDVTDLNPTDADPRIVRISVAGSGFLYNMVRILSGTLMEVGRGRMNPGDLPAIIAAKDRRAAGPTLPPTGLCLEWIKYEKPPAHA